MSNTYEGIFTVNKDTNESDTNHEIPSEQDERGILSWIRAKWQWCCRNWALLAGCALGLAIAAAFYALLGSIVAALFGASITAGATYGALAGVATSVWSIFRNRELVRAVAR